MTITVNKEGPYYVTEGTPISFSSLRTNFKEINSGKVSASEFIRNTSLTESNPIIPDATENANIVTTTANGVTLSQFRNSIKRYKIRQSTVGVESAETDLNIDTQTWNSNLDKNIQKTFEVTGVIGATSTANAAATFNAIAYNLTIDVNNGWILGKGGAAGTLNGGNGGNGGPALSVTNLVQKAITIRVLGTAAKIYGGGGGGGGGNKGADGDPGSPGSYSTYTKSTSGYSTDLTACVVNHGGSAYDACLHVYALCKNLGGTGSLCFENGKDGCGKDGNTRRKDMQITCDVPEKGTTAITNTAGGTKGTGGNGGNGGVGQGYGQAATNAPALDTPGGPVTAPALNTTGGPTSGGGGTATAGTVGSNGITGGNGGDYGLGGTAANPGGKGGTAGRAIAGSNYVVTGASTNTVKGLYNPQI